MSFYKRSFRVSAPSEDTLTPEAVALGPRGAFGSSCAKGVGGLCKWSLSSGSCRGDPLLSVNVTLDVFRVLFCGLFSVWIGTVLFASVVLLQEWLVAACSLLEASLTSKGLSLACDVADDILSVNKYWNVISNKANRNLTSLVDDALILAYWIGNQLAENYVTFTTKKILYSTTTCMLMPTTVEYTTKNK